MYFIGDTHGKTDRLRRLVDSLPPEAKKFQIGDMGLGFSGVSLRILDNFRFIRGNHDDPAKCKEHYNYAGEFGYLESDGVFFIGGAWSIDYYMRTPGVSWWPDEQLSDEQLRDCEELYKKVKPRIVASHEAPTKAAEALLRDLIGGYFDAKKDCANTRTSQAMQRMLDAHKPEVWVFGHYHIDKSFELEGCQFHCLAELSVKEVPSGNERSASL